ncbi:MAG: hypothetical protein J5818_01580 [Eggerthellaceae bacterium]|nr:hypothetical protein [Eggerthellaceae bacterium]
MDSLYEPLEMNEPTGFEPLEWDDEVYDEDEYGYADDPYTTAESEEDEYEEPGLGGWDDLRPFGSFSDGFGWDD